MFERIAYGDLNPRQQENYNFQKIAGRLANYGFNCLRLSDDWQGADFIACHLDGETFLKVQLKGRLVIDRKYIGKNVYIAFLHGDNCYVYPHDDFLDRLLALGKLGARGSNETWETLGIRHWPQPPAWALELISRYRI